MNIRFSLRTVLATLTLIAVGCGIISARLVDNRRQWQALAKALTSAERDGAKARCNFEGLSSRGAPDLTVFIEGKPITDETAIALGETRAVRYLIFDMAPSPQVEQRLAQTFDRFALTQNDFTVLVRRASVFDQIVGSLPAVVICLPFLALPLLLIYWTAKRFANALGFRG